MKRNTPFVKTLKSARQFKRLFGNSGKKKGLSSGLVSLKKGRSVGTHNTGRKEEILVILQGKARVVIAGRRFILRSGKILYIPPDTLHNVENMAARTLKYLYFTAVVI
ncbi:MAG: cupin domain-containing protein [Candidatus Omnitrophota bacterium]|jgi:mannose-6-phosphate isomerase-like protein (cupin superfamily)